MLLSRQEWIDACCFRDLSCREVLKEVASRVLKHPAESFILLDLDSTLFEVGPRNFQILKEWLETEEAALFPQVSIALSEMQLNDIGYYLTDTFRNLNLSLRDIKTQTALEQIQKFWRPRFFSSEYLCYDQVYLGAVEFVQDLYRLGAHLVYLTGRDEPKMGHGTQESLLKQGFPFQVERTSLLLKKSPEISDIEHKKEASQFIRSHGNLVASFENEPANIVALYDLFPQAMHVFVETVCNDKPARPCQGLYRVRSFEYSK